jgi:hypothetical protein
MRIIKSVCLSAMLWLYSMCSYCQLKSFNQMQYIANSKLDLVKNLIEFEGYKFYNKQDLMKDVKCDVWTLNGVSNNNNAVCLCKILSKYQAYLYVDSSLEFYQNIVISAEKEGYVKDLKSEFKWWQKGQKFLLVSQLDNVYCYFFANSMEGVITLGLNELKNIK